MSSKRSLIRTFTALSVVAVAGLSGCGAEESEIPRAAVRGTVQLDGVPLEEGVVRFVPDPQQGTHGPKTTVPVKEGQFEVPDEFGPVVGTHRVEIESRDDGGYALDDEHAFERLRAEGRRRIDVVRIPQVYNTRSQLTARVDPEGPNEFDFTLTTSARRGR